MGGKSTGTFSIDNGVGVFRGEVVDVPFLKAPGFIQVQSRDVLQTYPDVSSCQALKLTLKSYSDYSGYRASFGNAHPPHAQTFAFGYKADLKVPKSDEFVEVEVPFTSFSDLWDEASGKQIKSCNDFPEYCPDEKTLGNMKTIAIWAEALPARYTWRSRKFQQQSAPIARK